MLSIVCPECGETERLAGSRRGDTIGMRCEACGHEWTRDTRPRCAHCGSYDLRYTPKPLWEKGRGEQKTPAGRFDAYACNACGRRDATREDR
jgi:hypothetical protein